MPMLKIPLIIFIAIAMIVSFRYLPFFYVGAIDIISEDFVTPSLESLRNKAQYSNFFSSRFLSSRMEMGRLCYVDDVKIEKNNGSYTLNPTYKDGIILTDSESYYFYDGSSMDRVEEKDSYVLSKNYLVFSLSKQMLDFFVSYYNDANEREVLSLLLDISHETSYNGKRVKKAEYYASSQSLLGELRLYGENSPYVLSIRDYSSPSFILESVKEISELYLSEMEHFIIAENTLMRRQYSGNR